MNKKNIVNNISSSAKENKELIGLFNSGKFEAAKKKAMNLLNHHPKSYTVYNILGAIMAAENQLQEAIKYYKKSIEIKFDYAEAHNNLATALQKSGNFEEAVPSYNNALKYKPNFAEAHNNLGTVLSKLGKFDKAINRYHQALRINPNYAEAYSNFGNTLMESGKFEEAIVQHQKALKINPNYAEANFNESMIRLILGEFEVGWKKYEFRFKTSAVSSERYKVNKIWNGNYLDGTLLVWGEQGIGDHILFVSMITDLRKYAKKIILEIDKRLVNLFKRYCEKNNFSNIEVIDMEKKLINNFDKHIAIGSLGQYLRKSQKSFQTTPKKYLISSSLKEKELRKKFFTDKKFNVGICWKTLNKKQQYRNINLEQMKPILSNANCNFINLQFGEFDEDLNNLKSKCGVSIRTIRDIDNYNDIESLSALINCLDLVITIQNSTAHLSGALGKNTWIMLTKNARWHWLKNEKKSLWYPTVTLFRQQKTGYWNNVINSIVMDLKKITS